MLFCLYRSSSISTVHHIAKKNLPIVHSLLTLCLYLCMSNKQKQEIMKAKITQNVDKQMFIVWKLSHRNTGVRCIDKKPTWNVAFAFHNLCDAIKCKNSIVTSKTK